MVPRDFKRVGAPRVGRWLIYGILDPRTSTLVYVGKTHKRRELRLAEHIDSALAGSTAPIHQRIRTILDDGCQPLIFVLERVPADGSWREREREQIWRWRHLDHASLPVVHPPQTPKSPTTVIRAVALLNVRRGG